MFALSVLDCDTLPRAARAPRLNALLGHGAETSDAIVASLAPHTRQPSMDAAENSSTMQETREEIPPTSKVQSFHFVPFKD